ncbi:F0F1 ATP synthase subunit alpha [Zhengella mangrovi]|uniref:ATP synthase subunit alpha n=1 Tax=Zhengella mangrovi TaxID=1982044 RepID=A0A2G1QND7_9HYPH|nr:F0F1 ATP synthase subunit alpha [Zhengella mangrovi]PHP66984.1 F0F1 ATP synthase subunit alpha [Zhengella mangrovi]
MNSADNDSPAAGSIGLDRLIGRVGRVDLGVVTEELGQVRETGDGMAHVTGLDGARLGETLTFDNGGHGFVLDLEPGWLHAVILDQAEGIEAGTMVRRTGEMTSVPVGDGLLGRVVDPLGRALDDGPAIKPVRHDPVERPAPAIIDRDFVSQPVQTGILAVDALFSIGRGQRELIIGERATGKTAIAVDTIINQKASDIVCVYVAIGQTATSVRRAIEAVRTHGAIERCVFVVAEAAAEPGLRWLAPFAGATIAEFFRDRGQDALIVYDDLTKHAATHRELALLARQPPGREAYPSDIFYLHARLLERAAKLSADLGGGSLTALPIAEYEAGNLSAYIPTNLISIADGQLVLSSQLATGNHWPAIDIGLSVSRVGGKAQHKALKAVAGRVRLDYAQYQELKMFARFGGFADDALKQRIAHGERIAALLKQPRFSPLRLVDQVALLTALNDGTLDGLAPGDIETLKPRLAHAVDSEPALAGFGSSETAPAPDTRTALSGAVAAAAGKNRQG